MADKPASILRLPAQPRTEPAVGKGLTGSARLTPRPATPPQEERGGLEGRGGRHLVHPAPLQMRPTAA